MDAQKKDLKKWIIPAFLVLCLVQLYAPVSMIVKHNAVLTKGKLFRFKVAPLDPNDPFRGKYITLRYEVNSVKVKNVNEFLGNTNAFVILRTDSNGYAMIENISLQRPNGPVDYVEVHAYVINVDDKSIVHVEFPFQRFYMEETKAVGAEKMFLQTLRRPGASTVALVYVREGAAVLQDVLINEKSVNKLLK
ncbi:MAG: GDYXXLXY domain-containing protein [Arcticibacter sp.]